MVLPSIGNSLNFFLNYSHLGAIRIVLDVAQRCTLALLAAYANVTPPVFIDVGIKKIILKRAQKKSENEEYFSYRVQNGTEL